MSMAERPVLILPERGPEPRAKRPPGGGDIRLPPLSRQAARIRPELQAFREALDRRRVRLERSDAGVTPEEVAVLDVRGSVNDFLRAVEKTSDLEWLGEVEMDRVRGDEEFSALDGHGKPQPDRPIMRHLYLVFSNHDAHKQVMSLFRDYEAGKPLPRGFARWARVFERLKTVRPWNALDRLSDSGLESALREAEEGRMDALPCELELWYRGEREQREQAQTRVTDLISREGGAVERTCVIPEIRYHALSARLPVSAVRRLVPEYQDDIELIECEQLQYLRAAGQTSVTVAEGEPSLGPADRVEYEAADGPVLALFDGLPLAGHERLEDRLSIDDPDDFGNAYPASRRRHGTAMASLIVHGDLASPRQPVSRRIHVRPILRPAPGGQDECVPTGTLLPDLIHRAVRRLFESEGGTPPSAPTVKVVNLSIGIRNRPFGHSLSPLARLLDWLSWKYRILFIVSAGNHNSLPLSGPQETTAGALFSGQRTQDKFLRALAEDTSNRRLLSPAESMNAITVGAEHADMGSGSPPPRWTDPFIETALPALYGAHGMGYRRSIKPDILLPGGRAAVKEEIPGGGRWITHPGTVPPGHRVATPGPGLGGVSGVTLTRGTSNATALATREAALFDDLLEQLRLEPGGHLIDRVPRSVWIKTLLAHGADWKPATRALRRALEGTPFTAKFREFVARMIGYGAVHTERVRECSSYRVVALGGGNLENGESHIHPVPLARSICGKGTWKRLTVTLSWITPINPVHQAWRRAHLWFGLPALPIPRNQADSRAVQRGTLQHEVWEGRAALPTATDSLAIQVNCREDAGTLPEAVPYALAVSLEVADDHPVDIYRDIRAAVEVMRERIIASG